jgi:hypothetical protein
MKFLLFAFLIGFLFGLPGVLLVFATAFFFRK